MPKISNSENERFFPPETEEEEERRGPDRYLSPVSDRFYGLEAGSLARILHEDLSQESEMMMPPANFRPERRPLNRNERVLRFFQDKVYAHREKNGEWVKLKLKAEEEPLNKEERKKLLRLMDQAEEAAWRETERKFGKTISPSLTEKIEGILGSEKDFRVRAAIVHQGVPEDSGLLERRREVKLKEAKKQVGYIAHDFHEGSQEKIIAEIRKAREEERLAAEEEPMEEAA